ncbi:hypothetical protein [Micromonospora fluostatini]|uniref:hypothetical protein n=1 Tax=Micromonospora sp. JCM 30529 TaxID=3421643 RepID=UPI003D16DAC5
MRDDAYPFFIGPHRFDAPDDDEGPVLDRRYEVVPEFGERVAGRCRLRVSGHLLGPTEGRRQWALPTAATVTVTDRRLVYVCTGPALALVDTARRRRAPADDGPRQHGPTGRARLVTGQLRWQWPSRLELRPTGAGDENELFVVCDTLRTIRQPTLALTGPAGEVAELGRQLRRFVSTFRLTRPELVELSPPERDDLLRQVGPAPLPAGARVALAGALPVEFRSRDDYYRAGPGPAGADWSGPTVGPGPSASPTGRSTSPTAASSRSGPWARPARSAQPSRPGSAC